MQKYEAKNGLTYRHQGVIDWMLANPDKPLKEAQEATGFTPQYLYILRRSDFFRAEYEKRRAELDAAVHMEMVDKWTELEEAVIEKALLKLKGPVSEGFLNTAMQTISKRREAPEQKGNVTNFNFLASPEAIMQARARAAELARGRSAEVLDLVPIALPAGESVKAEEVSVA